MLIKICQSKKKKDSWFINKSPTYVNTFSKVAVSSHTTHFLNIKFECRFGLEVEEDQREYFPGNDIISLVDDFAG